MLNKLFDKGVSSVRNNKFLYYLLIFIYAIAHIITISLIIVFWRQRYIEFFLIIKEKGIVGVIVLSIVAVIVFIIIVLLLSYLSAKFSNYIDKFK